MKELIGKACKLLIKVGNSTLNYHANKVLFVTKTHLGFLDKFNVQYIFRLEDIVEVSGIQ